MKIALSVFLLLFLAGCAGNAARAREITNVHRRSVNDMARVVTGLGKEVQARCKGKRSKECEMAFDLYDGIRTSLRPLRTAIDAYEAALTLTDDAHGPVNTVFRLILKIRQLTNDLRKALDDVAPAETLE